MRKYKKLDEEIEALNRKYYADIRVFTDEFEAGQGLLADKYDAEVSPYMVKHIKKRNALIRKFARKEKNGNN